MGRFENGELVVDTIGIVPGGVVAGGYRTPETRLTERFILSANGSHLTIEYRWEDPKIYQTPHVYRYELDRLPEGSYAFEQWCDASDPRRAGMGHATTAARANQTNRCINAGRFS